MLTMRKPKAKTNVKEQSKLVKGAMTFSLRADEEGGIQFSFEVKYKNYNFPE